MKKLMIILCFVLASATLSQAAVKGYEINYLAGETQLKGYLAVNEKIEGKRPGVLVVHEWWGLNDYARERARMLAELGYTALAVDMYGDGKTAEHPGEAGQFAAAVRKNLPLAKERFSAALEVLKQQPSVNPDQLAAIGYCFGGAVVLEMARAGLDLDGVASFHGSLTTDNPAQPGRVKARIIVFNGADDPMISAEDIAAFKEEMQAAGADLRFINYPGATHSFTSPGADELGRKFDLPLAYNAEADAHSWQALQEFFREIFR
ncbi:dienelactone hydrolase family protein [Geoalkalibacter sp.]|uniref:dienelactone hydrolase family protein n=1 Tax=Geoalkalibacter sp. TaxID=3041440 RepID=UPI00272DCB2B|nr:dienelactone hydrolase family protein [Geoalkalibacter sp.]